MEINQITHEILDSAYKVHSALGPGLLESEGLYFNQFGYYTELHGGNTG